MAGLLESIFPSAGIMPEAPNLDDPMVLDRLIRQALGEPAPPSAISSVPPTAVTGSTPPPNQFDDLMSVIKDLAKPDPVRQGTGAPTDPSGAAPATAPRPHGPAPMPYQAGPSPLERLAATLQGGGDKGQGLIGRIGGMIGGGAGLERSRETENMTRQWLVRNGTDEDLATVVARNPELMQAIIKQRYAGEKHGLHPIYMRDDNGKLLIGQLTDRGGFKVNPAPQGLELTEGVDAHKLGTTVQLTGKKTGDAKGTMKIDVAGAAREKEVGEDEGKKPARFRAADNAMASLELDHQNVNRALDTALKNTGWFTAGFASVMEAAPGTPAHDLARTLDTVKAYLGFDRLQSIRDNSPTGGALGSVTEGEHKLLQSAWASVANSQDPRSLRDNLVYLKKVLADVKRNREAAFDRDFGDMPEVVDRKTIRDRTRKGTSNDPFGLN
jgi:hypothetical protein